VSANKRKAERKARGNTRAQTIQEREVQRCHEVLQTREAKVGIAKDKVKLARQALSRAKERAKPKKPLKRAGPKKGGKSKKKAKVKG
jgi:hypothetical protein